MGNTTYEVTLSVTGNHAVTVTSDDPAAITEALIWARQTHSKLARLAPAAPREERFHDSHADPDQQESRESPVCPIHHLPMEWMETGRGDFWSCHQRNDDGSFCTYKPNRGPRKV